MLAFEVAAKDGLALAETPLRQRPAIGFLPFGERPGSVDRFEFQPQAARMAEQNGGALSAEGFENVGENAWEEFIQMGLACRMVIGVQERPECSL